MNSVTNDHEVVDDNHHEEQKQQVPAPHHDVDNNSNKSLAETAFRLEEKKYKLYKPTKVGKKLIPAPETDFSEVLDFRNISQNSEELRKMIKKVEVPQQGKNNGNDDDNSDSTKEMYLFEGLPGLVFLPNFLSIDEQKYWMSRSLNEFSGPPYPNNETTLYLSPQQQEQRLQEREKAIDDGNDNNKNNNNVLHLQGYRNGLRWATLGYSYNWSKKTYHPDEKSPFPKELAGLVHDIVQNHFSHAFPPLSEQIAQKYEGQTSIVNYFPVGSQMCAHQDVSEAAIEKPLVSISLGCSAIFLMGTTCREDKPFAMFLRSGDVVIFSGGTREAFHAVPRVFDDTPSFFFSDRKNENAVDVVPGLRVNINVRQVFDEKNGPENLPDMKHFYCMKTANALKRKEEQEADGK